MLATYGIDTLDPAVSLRRIHVLVRRLPPGALPRVDEASWSQEAHLLARLNDVCELLIWVTIRASGAKAPRPKPMPRPGQTRRAGTPVKWNQLGGMLSGGAIGGG